MCVLSVKCRIIVHKWHRWRYTVCSLRIRERSFCRITVLDVIRLMVFLFFLLFANIVYEIEKISLRFVNYRINDANEKYLNSSDGYQSQVLRNTMFAYSVHVFSARSQQIVFSSFIIIIIIIVIRTLCQAFVVLIPVFIVVCAHRYVRMHGKIYQLPTILRGK